MRANRRNTRENGQATLLIVVALGICLLAGMGLTIDLSQMYAQRQLAQSAADATALASMMSIFNGTNTTNATFNNTFGNIAVSGQNPARLTCASTDNHTPCYYARQNGFDPSYGDTVYVDFWTQSHSFTQEPGVSISTSSKDTVPLLRVTIMRPVPTTLMRLVRANTMTVAAQATAAIVTSVSPLPILVLHPTMAGALTATGTGSTVKTQICGGPKRSIQVNSCAGTGSSVSNGSGGSVSCATGTAFSTNGNATIDLSKAGPLDHGGCLTGTGGDFGNFGYPTSVSGTVPVNMGTDGSYLDPASVVADPLITITAPTTTSPQALTNQDSSSCSENAGKSTCSDGKGNAVTCPGTDPAGSSVTNCTVFKPGIYTLSGPLGDLKNGYFIFTPGIYYIQSGGLSFNANSSGQSQNYSTTQGVYPTCANADADTGCGVMFFFAADNNAHDPHNVVSVSANASNIFLTGSDPTLTYQKILIFADHTAPGQAHTLGGGGTWNLTGTVYLTNTVNTILNSTGQSQYQSLTFQGNPSSGTVNGEIIVDALNLGGTPNITMNLDPASQQVRYIALVR